MRVWTLQPLEVYKILKRDGVFYCDPNKATWLDEENFRRSYNWLAEQMKQRIGEPPEVIKYPIWAWHTMNGKHKEPDLRTMECINYEGNMVCIELEIPDNEVLLSDEEGWHIILNDGFIPNAKNQNEFYALYDWYDSLSKKEQKVEKLKSWESIFDTKLVVDDFNSKGIWVQATFWELKYNQIINVRKYKGRKRP